MATGGGEIIEEAKHELDLGIIFQWQAKCL